MSNVLNTPFFASRFARCSSCSICPKGTYAATSGKETCDNCPGGKHLEDDGADVDFHNDLSDCLDCDKGKYSTGGASSCTSCEKSKYQDKTGQAMCEECDRGKSASKTEVTGAQSDGTDGIDCIACLCIAGQTCKFPDPKPESFTIDQIQCNSCAAGKFAKDVSQDKCEECEAGKYSGALAAACAECPPGEVPTPDKDGCVACVAGEYSPKPTEVRSGEERSDEVEMRLY